jgi:SAM-dependent methyltransferase
LAPSSLKQRTEIEFWKRELSGYQRWYRGELPELYGARSPEQEQMVRAHNERDSALLTWLELHQKPKYLRDLQLSPTSLRGRVLDVGAGPLPSALAFNGIELYCLDPLYSAYLDAGYPLHYYDCRFVNAACENIPLPDDSFDVVLSVNAIDHVDDFAAAAAEIRRVLKPDGKLAMHVHYHQPTDAEPVALSDETFLAAYGWCPHLRRVAAATEKTGSRADAGELYVLWRNF